MMKRLLEIMLIMALLCGGWLSGAEAQAATQALVPKTGQTTSYAAGDDGALQPGVALPTPRFTNNGNGTITDNLTGLIWLQNANCTNTVGGVAKSNGLLTWANALTWSNNLASGSCGLSDNSAVGDWRLPNVEELKSLFYHQNNPALPTGHPFSAVVSVVSAGNSNYYWSSTTYAFNTSAAASLGMDSYMSNTYKINNNYVWPVRGGQSGAFASLSLSPGTKDFGNVTTNATSTGQAFTITNSRNANLVVSSIAITGGDSGMFTLNKGDGTGGTCGATPNIVPAGSCTVTATFTPTSAGAKSTTLRISSNDSATPNKDISITGTGVVLPTYTIGTAVVGGNGNIACDSPVNQGATSVCIITPSTGYHLATFTDDTVDKLASVTSGSYTISNVQATHAILGTFAANTYTVSFTSNDGSAVNSQTVNYNATASQPTAPTKTGYTFAGWYSDAAQTTAFTFTTAITADTTLYAKWQINSYTVSFTSNGGSAVTSQSVTYNTTATAPVVPTKTGYTFAGWYSDAALTTAFAFTTAITADTTLYAKWQINTYTVSFTSNGGSAVTNQSVAYNTTATAPTAPSKTSYTFAGWYTDNALTTAFTFTTAITGDTTLYAKWTINSYTVTFTSNGGSAVTSQSVNYNATANQPTAPTRTGYTFAGWYSDAALTTAFVFTTSIAGDTTLFAKWTALNYTLTFAPDSNGNLSGTPSQTVSYGGNSTAVTAMPATGYQLVNWTGTGGFVTTSANPLTVTNVTADMTITANFTASPVNGACGSNNGGTFSVIPVTNLCTTGAASAVTGSGPWNWSCGGLNGGTTAGCSASIQSFTATPDAGNYGAISPATPQMVSQNGTTNFTITPTTGYQIDSVIGCNGVLTGTTYTTGAITGNCSVTVGYTGAAHSGILIPAKDKTAPDIGDALKVFQATVGITNLSTAQQAAADAGPLGADGKPVGNGTVDVGDVVVILRRVVGASNW
jgi:uncharacterized repeat protein (TIGR02543 family)